MGDHAIGDLVTVDLVAAGPVSLTGAARVAVAA
jgi:tRNA-2-methylthio-N6-dimethylallyladenosine synthase